MARESSLPLRPPRMIQRTRTGHGTVPVVRRAWRSDATSERDPLNRLVPRPAAIGRAHHEGRRRPVACKPVRLWHPNPPNLKSIAKGDGMELFPISRIPRSGLGRTGCGASRGSGEVRTSAQEGATPQRQRIRCNRPDLLLATGWRCQRSPRNWPPPPLALTHPGSHPRSARIADDRWSRGATRFWLPSVLLDPSGQGRIRLERRGLPLRRCEPLVQLFDRAWPVRLGTRGFRRWRLPG